MKAKPYSLRALRATRSATIPHVPLSRDQRIAARAKNAKGTAVPVPLRHETAERVISAVIKRIEWPRHGAPVSLSATDKADAMGAGMLACAQSNFFHHGIMSLRIVKGIRNAIQGPDCLRLRRKWETHLESVTELSALAGFATEYEDFKRRLTPSQKDMAKEIMTTLRAAFQADTGRKRVSNFRNQRGFFFVVLGELTGKTGRLMSQGAFREASRTFLDYLADGAKALRSRPFHGRDVAKEITAALQSLTLA